LKARRQKSHRSLATAILTSSSIALMMDVARAGSMDDFAWNARPVLVFAASHDDTRATEQLRLLADLQAEQTERHVVVIEVWPGEVRGAAGKGLDSDRLRSRFGVAAGSFAVLLVGKDTGVKRRVDEVIDPRVLFSQIDGMPMRQREMRESR